MMKPAMKTQCELLAVILFAGLALALVLQFRVNTKLRTENASLAQDAAEARKLGRQLTRPSHRQLDTEELARLRGEHSELIRLRGEVGSLRRQLEEQKNRSLALEADRNRLESTAARTNSPSSAQPELTLFPVGKYVSSDAWQDVGQSSPRTALQTFLWASKSRDLNRFADLHAALTSEKRAGMLARYNSPEAWEMLPWVGAKGSKVLLADQQPNGERFYVVKFDYLDKEEPLAWHFYLKQEGEEWKIRQIGQVDAPPPRFSRDEEEEP